MSHRYFAKKPDEKRAEAKGDTKISKRGSPNRRIIFQKSKNGYERSYHATKGWRGQREPEIGATPAGELYASFLPS